MAKADLSRVYMDVMERKDWVSVIIPTWNRADFLAETLESVAAQTYRPLEIWVIDDGSDDHTEQVVSEFRTTYADASLEVNFRQQSRQGASIARNLGLQHSTGAYIQFLDSDDLLHPLKIQAQVTALRNSGVAFAWSASVKFNEEVDWDAQAVIGERMPVTISKEEAVIEFVKKSRWRTESGLYTREACARTGLWQPLVMFQDWEYNIRLLSWLPDRQYVPGNFTAVRVHDQGRIGDKWANGQGLEGVLEAIQEAADASHPSCGHLPEWQEAIIERFVETKEKALSLGMNDVANLANEYMLRFKESLVNMALEEGLAD